MALPPEVNPERTAKLRLARIAALQEGRTLPSDGRIDAAGLRAAIAAKTEAGAARTAALVESSRPSSAAAPDPVAPPVAVWVPAPPPAPSRRSRPVGFAGSVEEFFEDEGFRGWSVRPGGSKGLVWTLKGTRPDGGAGYFTGQCRTYTDCLQAAERCLRKGDWRADKF